MKRRPIGKIIEAGRQIGTLGRRRSRRYCRRRNRNLGSQRSRNLGSLGSRNHDSRMVASSVSSFCEKRLASVRSAKPARIGSLIMRGVTLYKEWPQ
ncbi:MULTISPECIES: hypothetical protein [unclassified Bradyrhizobium]|uniref:hypothetical protein n=1 Tax=unclassified Bradyrhizobium TaxID=2631580 RepID=UPI0024792D13|nr:MULTISPECIES: hypothetical protein [unclassified Bradyrhizobium]WGR70505.1 hypothetical protein MTX24_35015 [Bradyrhizobium sp. ISRA426]WGR82561.1 hypothetical protein MTX21_20115 [Bradyrhizobium sp. ISRA430]WGR85748.1 hypothetical protein MTX25_34700 [Bradyrhizobium sp. ISRA432]